MDAVVSGLSGAPVTENRSTACFSAALLSERNRHFSDCAVSQARAFIVPYLGAYSRSLVALFLALTDEKGTTRHLLQCPTCWPVEPVCWLAALPTIPLINLVAGRPPFERSWVRSFESRPCRICGFGSRLPFAPNRHPKCNMSNSRDSVTYAR
jgi:hypothetical protein